MRLPTVSKLCLIAATTVLLAACAKPFWESWSEPGYQHQPLTPEEMAQQQQQQAQSHYRKADRLPPKYNKARKRCVTTANGHEVCGYDCKVVGDYAKCAQEPKQRCVVSPSGQIKCGYNCKVTHLQAKCGKYLYDNCVTNAIGEVRCGNNCREREDGELVCGK